MAENNTNNIGQFSIKVRTGNAEIEVSAPDKDFVLDESQRLISQFKLDTIIPSISNGTTIIQGELVPLSEVTQAKIEKPETLGEFYRQFISLQTNLDKILAFGYWCEIKQNQPHFTSDDVLAKYKEAREVPPGNIRRDLGSLVAKGFLLPPGKSDDGTQTYALSKSGIKEVESKMSQA